jgi:hypothetical protein
LLLIGLVLPACAQVGEEEEEIKEPATIETIAGSDVSRITLTEQAVERVDIQAAPVVIARSGTAIPYAAVFYTSDGQTWSRGPSFACPSWWTTSAGIARSCRTAPLRAWRS